MKTFALVLLVSVICSAYPVLAQNQTLAIEAGVTSPTSPVAQAGFVIGGGGTRSYTRFAYEADGSTRGVETGIEQRLLHSKRFDIITRAIAGLVQDENNTSGSVAGQFGFQIPIRWGLSVVTLGEGGNSPVRDGVWKAGASLGLRWQSEPGE